MEEYKRKLLFVCAGNYCRSPTGEALVAKADGYEAKSAGIFEGAVKVVSQEMLDWADLVFVMEDYMKDALTGVEFYWAGFGFTRTSYNVDADKIKVLHIPDMYGYGNPELVDELKRKLMEFGVDVRNVRFDPWWKPVQYNLERIWARVTRKRLDFTYVDDDELVIEDDGWY